MCMGQRFGYPPPPALAWAPNMALAQKLKEGQESFFVTMISTPCGTGPFVNYCSEVVIAGDCITLQTITEGRRHEFPEEDQQWNISTIVYFVDESGEFLHGELMIDETLWEMPECFRECPANIDDIAGHAKVMAAQE